MEGQGLDWHGRTVGRNTVEEGGLEAGVPLDFWGMAESGKCDLQARIKRSKACSKARSLVKVPDSFDNVQQYCSLIAHNMVCAARCFHPLLACAFSACFMFVDTDVMLQNPFSWQSSGTCTAKDLEDQSFKVSWSVMHAPFTPPLNQLQPGFLSRETIVCLVYDAFVIMCAS